MIAIEEFAAAPGTRPHCKPADPTQPTSRDVAPSDSERVLSAALELLAQGEALLAAIEDSRYQTRVALAFNGTIGGHYRHCLDHFHSVVRGLETGLVDYDDRERDPRIETEPTQALAATQRLMASLGRLDAERLTKFVRVRCEVSYEHGDSPVTASTLARELAYAVAHAIHHHALISVMARLQNVALPPTFGVAPSTVAHQRRIGTAA